jgi:hypothetical protein
MAGNAVHRTHVVRYHRNATLVTDTVVVTADGARYDVANLRALAQSRGPTPRQPIAAIGIGLILVPGAVLAALFNHSPNPIVVACVGLVLMSAATRVCAIVAPRRWDLCAFHRDAYVVLFSTVDPREFGFVRRAVQRSMEAVQREPALTRPAA